MSQEILINVTPREIRVALLENAILQEIQIERHAQQSLVGNIYKGRVNRLLPGIQAAFVDIGLERMAFLHARDVKGLLHVGQDIFVQVYKDTLGSKGVRVTMQFTIPSRYLVFTPRLQQITVSQRIADAAERQRLMNMLIPTEQGGYIFRTAAEGVSQTDMDADKTRLDVLWTEVQERISKTKLSEIAYAEIPMVLRVLRDLVGDEVKKIRVDDAEAARQMQEFAKRYVPALLERIAYYSELRPIFDIHAVEEQLQKALQRKVPLKSGGHVVFDQTEAMTTIDVNTGSYLGSAHAEETLFKTNLEAAAVIAHQIRLRNLGGIIIVDFIDMQDPIHKEQLLQALTTAVTKDNAKVQISELSSLGLVQMTRKRTQESLEHILCVPCPTCQRRGSIKSLASMSYEILRELQLTAQNYSWPGFLVLAAQEVVNYLSTEESALLADVETKLGKPIKLQVELSYGQEQYDILPGNTP